MRNRLHRGFFLLLVVAALNGGVRVRHDWRPSGPNPVLSTVWAPDTIASIMDYGVYTTMDPRDGQAFIRNEANGTLDVLDTATGALRHRLLIDPDSDVYVAPEVGRVFIIANGQIQTRDARTQAPVRAVTIADDPYDIAVDARNGRVFFAGDKVVHMLDAYTGRQLLAIPIRQTADFPIAIDARSGRVFVFGPNGMMTTLDAWSGRVLRATRLHGAVYGAVVDEATGRIFVAHRDATIDVPVDERTGHVFVVDQGSDATKPDPWRWVPPAVRQRLPFLPPPGTESQVIHPSITVLDVDRR